MGSEMCIRDRYNNSVLSVNSSQLVESKALGGGLVLELGGSAVRSSLLGGFLLRRVLGWWRCLQVVVAHSHVVVTRFSFCNTLVKS